MRESELRLAQRGQPLTPDDWCDGLSNKNRILKPRRSKLLHKVVASRWGHPKHFLSEFTVLKEDGRKNLNQVAPSWCVRVTAAPGGAMAARGDLDAHGGDAHGDGDSEAVLSESLRRVALASSDEDHSQPLELLSRLHVFRGRWKRIGARGLNNLVNCEQWLSEFLNVSLLQANDESNPFSCACLVMERYSSLEDEAGGAEINYYPLVGVGTPTVDLETGSQHPPQSTVNETFMGRQWVTEVELLQGGAHGTPGRDARGNRETPFSFVFHRSSPANGRQHASVSASAGDHQTSRHPLEQFDMAAIITISVDGLMTEKIKQKPSHGDGFVFSEKLFHRLGSPLFARSRALHDAAVAALPPHDNTDSASTATADHGRADNDAAPRGDSGPNVGVFSVDLPTEPESDEQAFATMGAAYGVDGLEKISPLSLIEQERYRRFCQLLEERMVQLFHYQLRRASAAGGGSRSATPHKGSEADESQGEEHEEDCSLSFDDVGLLLRSPPCMHLRVKLPQLLQDMTQRLKVDIPSAREPGAAPKHRMLSWIHNELCLRELYQICQRSPPGNVSTNSAQYNPPVRKHLLISAVEDDLFLCAQISK